MRTASQDYDFVFNKNGSVSGIALGFDFCAEHEDGVSELKQQFAVSYQERTGWQSYVSAYANLKNVKPGLHSRCNELLSLNNESVLRP